MPSEEKKKHTKTDTPLVSIITPLYNAEAFISQSIASIQNQTYTHWEHIVVDDASTDESLIIAQQAAAKDPRIVIVPQKTNQGAAVARNLATHMANGRYIAFLDADDLWMPTKLSKQVAFMQQHQCGVCFTSYIQMDDKGIEIGKRIKALATVPYKKQLVNNYIGNLTGMYDTTITGKILAPSIRKRQDWAVWLQAIENSKQPARGIYEDLAKYRVRKGSMSSNKFKLIKYNYAFYHQHLGYNKFLSGAYLLRFFWEYFMVRPKQIQTYKVFSEAVEP